jgi:hypothetical protein
MAKSRRASKPIEWADLPWWTELRVGLQLNEGEVAALHAIVAAQPTTEAAIARLEAKYGHLADVENLPVHDLLELTRMWLAVRFTEDNFLGRWGSAETPEQRRFLLRAYLLYVGLGWLPWSEHFRKGLREVLPEAAASVTETPSQFAAQAIAATIAGPAAAAEITRLVEKHGGTQVILVKMLNACDAAGVPGPGRDTDLEAVAKRLRAIVAPGVRETRVAPGDPHSQNLLGDLWLALHQPRTAQHFHGAESDPEVFLSLFERALAGDFNVLLPRIEEEATRNLTREGEFRRLVALCSGCGAPWKKSKGYQCGCSPDARRVERLRKVSRVDAEEEGAAHDFDPHEERHDLPDEPRST